MVKEEKICEFISFVHSNPALYSKSDAEYKNNDIKNALWKKAANEFGMKGFLFDLYEWNLAKILLDGAEAAKKFKNLRDGFVRSTKKPPSGDKARPEYLYKNEMQFLLSSRQENPE